MSRYIDADKLIERILRLTIVTDDMYGMGIACGIERAVNVIQKHPTADVVEVVRCKDCKRFLQMETSPSYDGKCLGYGYLVEANHYCSYGERREDKNND